MTVAAVILAPSPQAALADADGTPAVRRIADAAHAGGATPVVVVAPDPEGAVAAALATADVLLIAPDGDPGGPAAQIVRAVRAATGLISGTTAALVWPVRFAWADAETTTTLLETHGEDPGAVLRPRCAESEGWPALLPVAAAEALSEAGGATDLDAALAALGGRAVDTGDPGTTHDISVPRADLPPFEGPPRADDSVDREWGAPAAAEADADAPGPGRP